MCRWFLLIIIFVYSGNRVSGQNKTSIYQGLWSETYTLNEKTAEYNAEWKKKTLHLNNDSSFSFEYMVQGHPCAARPTIRKCTGTYTIHKDTIILKSKYSEHHFCKVVESHMENIPVGKIRIVTSYPDNALNSNTFISDFNLIINDSLVGEYKINDTIYYDVAFIKHFSMNCCSPYEMDWRYMPISNGTNYFKFTLIRNMDGENISMTNNKLLKINKNELLVVEGEFLKVSGNKYKWIKNK
jgi:hypothetical protein